MQPVHQTSDRLMAEARPGPDRLAGAYAWNSMRRPGAPLAFGSDAPVELPDPFAGIAAAITREDATGQPFGGWQPQQAITREQALAAYTSGAAYAGFAEGHFGQLAPGERADFLFVDRTRCWPARRKYANTKVLEVWMDGRQVTGTTAPPDAEDTLGAPPADNGEQEVKRRATLFGGVQVSGRFDRRWRLRPAPAASSAFSFAALRSQKNMISSEASNSTSSGTASISCETTSGGVATAATMKIATIT